MSSIGIFIKMLSLKYLSNRRSMFTMLSNVQVNAILNINYKLRKYTYLFMLIYI